MSCNRGRTFKSEAKSRVKTQVTTKTNLARVNAKLCTNGKCRVSSVNDEHNHVKSPSRTRFFRHNRVIPSHVQRTLKFFDNGGIGPSKSLILCWYKQMDQRTCRIWETMFEIA